MQIAWLKRPLHVKHGRRIGNFAQQMWIDFVIATYQRHACCSCAIEFCINLCRSAAQRIGNLPRLP